MLEQAKGSAYAARGKNLRCCSGAIASCRGLTGCSRRELDLIPLLVE
jgi:hypothetical protein